MPRNLFIIPCYNEEKRLRVKEFLKFSKTQKEIHILFVNDGSTDKTAAILQELCIDVSQFTFLNLEKNEGKSGAIRQGVLHLEENNTFDYIGYLDADLATPLTEIPRLISEIEKREKSKLEQILILADMAKFAKQQPIATENEEALKNAYLFIEQTALKVIAEEFARCNIIHIPTTYVLVKA